MGNISDKAQTTESLGVGLDESPAIMYPCPTCGKATKEHAGPEGTRICSNRACEDRKAMKTVHVSALKKMEVAPEGPKYPCPKCGKESKEHHAGGRICSSAVCRNTFAG